LFFTGRRRTLRARPSPTPSPSRSAPPGLSRGARRGSTGRRRTSPPRSTTSGSCRATRPMSATASPIPCCAAYPERWASVPGRDLPWARFGSVPTAVLV